MISILHRISITLYMVLQITNGLKFTAINSTLDNVYSYSVTDLERHVFIYKLNSSLFGNPNQNSLKIVSGIKPQVHSNFQEIECPLILTAKYRNSVFTWMLDSQIHNESNSTWFQKVERTICMDSDDLNENFLRSSDDIIITVEVSTCSTIALHYTLSSILRRDVLIHPYQTIKTELSPGSPQMYQFKFSDCVGDFAFIQLTSTSESCMIISVQEPHCPVFDKEDNYQNRGHWQSVTIKTGMSLRRSEYPNGFYIVFLLLPDDSRCKVSNELNEKTIKKDIIRHKIIHFTVRDDFPKKDNEIALISPFVLFVFFVSCAYSLHLYFYRYRCRILLQALVEKNNELGDCNGDANTCSISDASNEICQKSKFGLRSQIFIKDLIDGQPERLIEQSKRYFMAGVLVTSFYCVPVFQLIFSYHSQLAETGNFDLCYFNYLCSHTLEMFHDFNHIYSNIGYLICGAVFMLLVHHRKKSMIISSTKDQSLPNPYTLSFFPKAPCDISNGVFVHYGLFYAMGFSLFMTGVMSAGYHICPNQNNFQFDTPFMYTIVALGTVTIYQFRHPTYVSASLTFMTLAIVAASTVLGLIWESLIFLVIFTILHMTFLFIILTYIHYIGYVRANGKVVTDRKKMLKVILSKWKHDICSWNVLGFQRQVWQFPQDSTITIVPGPCRLLFPLLTLGTNAGGMAIVWTYLYRSNFASQVLTIYVINSAVYMTYYCLMKIVHGEYRNRLLIQPFLYYVTSVFLWVYSLSYFGDEVTLWEKSPAESRARNVECTLLGMYDSHDVWHFISSSALFSSLMVLLTIDDDLVTRPKSKIPVF